MRSASEGRFLRGAFAAHTRLDTSLTGSLVSHRDTRVRTHMHNGRMPSVIAAPQLMMTDSWKLIYVPLRRKSGLISHPDLWEVWYWRAWGWFWHWWGCNGRHLIVWSKDNLVVPDIGRIMLQRLYYTLHPWES